MRYVILEEVKDVLLLEDKISSLKEKLPEQTELIDFFASKDPTGKQKYFEWALKRTLQGNESKELVADAFLKFDQIGPRLEKKDINQYETAERVFDAINYYETVQRSERSKGKEKKKTAYKAAESGEGEHFQTLYEDDEYIMIRLLSREGSCYWGRGTPWCIAAQGQNYFYQYTINDGVVFFNVINKTVPLEDVISNRFSRINFAVVDQGDGIETTVTTVENEYPGGIFTGNLLQTPREVIEEIGGQDRFNKYVSLMQKNMKEVTYDDWLKFVAAAFNRDEAEAYNVDELRKLMKIVRAGYNPSIEMMAEMSEGGIPEEFLKYEKQIQRQGLLNNKLKDAVKQEETPNLEYVKDLIRKGANVRTSNNLAIRWASAKGHVEVVKILLSDKRVDPTADDNYAFQWASEYGQVEVVKILLSDKRVDPTAGNNLAIRVASANGHVEVVKILLSDKRVVPSADDNAAIRWASANGHVEVVKILYQHNPDHYNKETPGIVRKWDLDKKEEIKESFLRRLIKESYKEVVK